MYCGQTAADGVQVADGIYREIEQLDYNAADHNGNEGRRYALFKYRVDHEYCKADKADYHCPYVPCGEVLYKRLHLFKRLYRRFAVHVFYAEKVLELAEKNGDGNARSKAGSDGIGNVLYQCAETE